MESIECEFCDKEFITKNYLEHPCQTDWYCGTHNCFHAKEFDSSNCILNDWFCCLYNCYHTITSDVSNCEKWCECCPYPNVDKNLT